VAGVIIFPTDTVYGIGAKIYDLKSINRIYEIKNRPKDKPLACLCASLEQIKEIAYVNEFAEKQARKKSYSQSRYHIIKYYYA